MSSNLLFNEHEVLHNLKHYLPSQNPLKDFIHHNTLHAFQHQKFHAGLQEASQTFGFQTYLTLNEYRELYQQGKISDTILNQKIKTAKGETQLSAWREKLLTKHYETPLTQKVGKFRSLWKTNYQLNLDKEIHPILFRLVSTFLDQGISIEPFPYTQHTFLNAIKELNNSSLVKIIKSKRAVEILNQPHKNQLTSLLKIIVGDEKLYEQYLFDQQFAHPGWSGMVAVLEDNPVSLLDKRTISLHDFIVVELLLELDQLEKRRENKWKPLALAIKTPLTPLFEKQTYSELHDVYSLWQEAYEWTYYDEVLKGLQTKNPNLDKKQALTFQATFCIDDRECSIRRHLEQTDNACETFSTAGFFNLAFYFQPEHGKFHTKVCPAPQFPGYLIKEHEASKRHKTDNHFNKNTHGFFGGLFFGPTLGFWSAIKMAKSILFPAQTDALVSSFKHMDRNGQLSIDAAKIPKKSDDLQIGFTLNEMVDKMEGLFKGIGLMNNFAPLVYWVGHGASSVNNTHYAGYDCGACSGRAGSVNARIAANIANRPEVRAKLKERNIFIPDSTQFVGALHDTTRDEVEFYDEHILSEENKKLHQKNCETFQKALTNNAKERARRFLLINSEETAQKVHDNVKLRSLSLFEPRPEWNHATNTLCIIGKRENNKHLFFDRRAFLNSYDYSIDADGKILLGILNAAAPVCGGINLEYYFSRIDNYRLGAGSKLPHNVMGLIGVANGMDGDLRTGLPMQKLFNSIQQLTNGF